MSEPDIADTRVPGFLRPLIEGVRGIDATGLLRMRVPPPPEGGRRAAVLMLFAEGPAGPDVLLLERASTLRTHAGQVAFPGGGIDPGDSGPVAAALREAEEETGLDPAGVTPLRTLPELFLPPSGFVVTPVIAHWPSPVPVHAVDHRETARVVRVPIAELTNPANRLTVAHPRGGSGPAFDVAGLLVWGFTAGLLSALVERAGWERPWDSERVVELGAAWQAARERGRGIAGA
ncbi:MAG: CoA pyrophosphatase [Pseudonocardia sp.]|nr:CoA pyrophosphatase [Pseudonocardia sp.]